MNIPVLQRNLGIIEGLTYAVDPAIAETLCNALEAIDAAISDVCPQPVSDSTPRFWECEWFDIKEKQPIHEGSYLCIGNTGTVHTSKWYTGEGSKVAAHFSNANVTHWAYLPAPPRGKAE